MKLTAFIARNGRDDLLFRAIAAFCGMVIVVVMAGILFELVRHSHLALEEFGLAFPLSLDWNPVTQEFGAASSIFGTIVSSLIAMILAVPLSLAIAGSLL